MRRSLLILALGLAVGATSHLVYFAAHRPPDSGTLDGQLAWMKSELHLTDAQFARIRALHEASNPRLRALASEVARMQSEFAAFENARRSTDRVDFVEFAKFVETRRAISKQCLDSTRELVMAAADEMTPQQRAHYLGLVAAARPLTTPSPF